MWSTINRSLVSYGNRTFTIASGTTIPLGASPTLSLMNTAIGTYYLNLINNGTLVVGTGTFTAAVDGTFTNNGLIRSRTTNLSGSIVNSAGSTIEFLGDGDGTPDTFTLTDWGTSYKNLVINATDGADDVFVLGANLNVAEDLTILAGVLNLQSYTANRTAAGGTLTVADGATLKIGGTNTLPANYSTHAIGSTSTIEYSGAGQLVSTLNSAQEYGHLTLSGSGAATLGGNIAVGGTLTVSGASLEDDGYTLTAKGDITHDTSHTGSGKILLTGGSAAHNLSGGGSYTNLELDDANGVTLASDATINGTLTLTDGNITTGANTLAISSSGTVSRTSGHVAGNLQKYIPTRRRRRPHSRLATRRTTRRWMCRSPV